MNTYFIQLLFSLCFLFRLKSTSRERARERERGKCQFSTVRGLLCRNIKKSQEEATAQRIDPSTSIRCVWLCFSAYAEHFFWSLRFEVCFVCYVTVLYIAAASSSTEVVTGGTVCETMVMICKHCQNVTFAAQRITVPLSVLQSSSDSFASVGDDESIQIRESISGTICAMCGSLRLFEFTLRTPNFTAHRNRLKCRGVLCGTICGANGWINF